MTDSPERIWTAKWRRDAQWLGACRAEFAESEEYIHAGRVAEMVKQAVLAEREACAALVEAYRLDRSPSLCADAIRARTQAGGDT